MPDVDPQFVIDVEHLPQDHFTGAPADETAREAARADFYQRLLAELPQPPACLPDRGVHIYADHRGAGPCLCKTTSRPKKGVR